ncbi:MAG: EAL domain-containing protein [Aeromicrobium sp.]
MTGEIFAGPDAESVVLRQMIEATPHAMMLADDRMRIVLVNSRTEALFGHARADLFTMNLEALFPARYRMSDEDYRATFFGPEELGEPVVDSNLFGLHRDGHEFPVEVVLTRVHIAGRPHLVASVVDITERLAAAAVERERTADQLRRSILDSLPFSIIATEPDGTIVTANPAAERLLGFDHDELVGSPIGGLRESHRIETPLTLEHADEVGEREIDYSRKDGSMVPVNEAVTLISDDEGGVSGVLSVAYDISQRREAEAFIRHVAQYDVLTDLPNRSKLFDCLDAHLRTAHRTGRGFAVAMLDLDHFKRVNDSLGHHVGDELLIAIAARLRSQMRDGDMVARPGGDEFVLVFADVDNRRQVEQRIAAVLASIPEPVTCDGHELIVTASMGVALHPSGGLDAITLMRHADTATYHAKAAARNSVRWFEDSMLDETNDKLEMATALRHALDRDELSVFYQIQVSLLTGEVVGVEALARWRTADGVHVPPDRFIAVAEDNGLIIRLGEWVLRRACIDTAAVSRAVGLPLTLAVNVSPRQFHDKNWLTVLQRVLDESGLPPDRLELEITEGILMEDPDGVVDVLHTVRSLGAAVVVDDFGTGFSSLSYLTRFPIDTIKVDRSFVAGVVHGAADAAIVDTIIVMAHTLGMTVVGEGVETQDQERYLRARGCDVAQGYLYSKAVPVDELAAAIRGPSRRG